MARSGEGSATGAAARIIDRLCALSALLQTLAVGAMKLTISIGPAAPGMISRSPAYINPLKDRELDLRGALLLPAARASRRLRTQPLPLRAQATRLPSSKTWQRPRCRASARSSEADAPCAALSSH